MASPISYVSCPHCSGRFYVYRPDFEQFAGAHCFCPFCRQTFEIADGQPYPAVASASGAGHPR
jgi:hypothetical protein